MAGCICHSGLCFCFCNLVLHPSKIRMKYPFQVRPDQLPRQAATGIVNQPKSFTEDLQFWQTNESLYEIYYFGKLISSWNGRNWESK